MSEPSIAWDRLIAVAIQVTRGPTGPASRWQFLLDDGLVELPGADVDPATFAALQARLPGLDVDKVVRASRATRERVFRVWHRDDSRWAPAACTLAARFAALVGRLGGDGAAAAAVFERLRAAWSSPARSYHDLEHLVDCLRELDRARAAPPLADVVELALWYHDAVYLAGAPDCEEQSARLLLADAGPLALPADVADRAAALVRATAHGSATPAAGDPATELLLDLDLSILGRDPLRFLDFDHGVEEEYAAIPTAAFRAGRARFLAALLARPRLFLTDALHARFEAPARRNLAALLAGPRYRDAG